VDVKNSNFTNRSVQPNSVMLHDGINGLLCCKNYLFYKLLTSRPLLIIIRALSVLVDIRVIADIHAII